MVAKFYKFSKRLNSTKQPTGSGLFEPDCKLKQNCSEHDPVLVLATNAFDYTYVYIDAWKKYYFVQDVVSLANGLVEYHLAEDVLATYKSDIGSVQAHIVFSSSDYDDKVIDPRLIVKNERHLEVSSDGVSVFGPYSDNDPHYLVTVLNGESGTQSSGVSVTYALTNGSMQEMRAWLCDTSPWQTMQTYFNGEPLNGIFECKWVPYKIDSSLLTQVSQMYIGNATNSGSWAFVQNAYMLNSDALIIQGHEMSVNLRYTDFRSIEPYTTGTLFLPGVGHVELCMGDWDGETTLRVLTTIEVITGNVKYQIMRGSTQHIVQTFDCNVSAKCPMGRISTDAAGMMAGIGTMAGGVAGLVGAAASGAGGLAIAGAGAAIIMGAANTILANNRHASSVSGSFGGRTVLSNPYIKHSEYSVNTEDPADATYTAVKGRPCNGMRTISSLSGYIQCDNASIDCNANMMEKTEINTFLNSGFYYE